MTKNSATLPLPMEVFTTHCASPIGILRISGTMEGVTDITFLDGWEEHRKSLQECTVCPSVLSECREQLREYFGGERRDLRTLRITPMGTEFQRSVWHTLLEVPFGESITYKELGKRIGYALAARAVGGAVARNPLAIIIPCHRVLPEKGGGRGGYVWGAWRKQWLLRHEGTAVTLPSSGPRVRCCTQEGSSPSQTPRGCVA